jgi:hypothetical protein
VGTRTYSLLTRSIVEDADSLRIESDAIKFSNVGHMTIKVFRISNVRDSNHAPRYNKFKDKVGAEVAEKAIKGRSLSHCTA